jgi:hypothetical protein
VSIAGPPPVLLDEDPPALLDEDPPALLDEDPPEPVAVVPVDDELQAASESRRTERRPGRVRTGRP